MEGYYSRLAVNVPLLTKILDLRRQIAKLMGYKSRYLFHALILHTNIQFILTRAQR